MKTTNNLSSQSKSRSENNKTIDYDVEERKVVGEEMSGPQAPQYGVMSNLDVLSWQDPVVSKLKLVADRH